MDDQMQSDTDAGCFAFMQEHADDKTWVQFTTMLLTS